MRSLCSRKLLIQVFILKCDSIIYDQLWNERVTKLGQKCYRQIKSHQRIQVFCCCALNCRSHLSVGVWFEYQHRETWKMSESCLRRKANTAAARGTSDNTLELCIFYVSLVTIQHEYAQLRVSSDWLALSITKTRIAIPVFFLPMKYALRSANEQKYIYPASARG